MTTSRSFGQNFPSIGCIAVLSLLILWQHMQGLNLKQELSNTSANNISPEQILSFVDTGDRVGGHAGGARDARRTARRQKYRARPELKYFIGVFTGCQAKDPEARPGGDYHMRRQALRETWFPGSKDQHARWEQQHSMVFRFVVGHSDNPEAEAALAGEEQQFGDFMRLPITETRDGATNKTLTFFNKVSMEFQVEWLVKTNDDVYLIPGRLPMAAEQWSQNDAHYIGCMTYAPVEKDPGSPHHEPDHVLVSNKYPMHAHDGAYIISGRIVSDVIVRNMSKLRIMASVDGSLAVWMLAYQVTHYNDKRLCEPSCSSTALSVVNWLNNTECSGLCEPVNSLRELHTKKECNLS